MRPPQDLLLLNSCARYQLNFTGAIALDPGCASQGALDLGWLLTIHHACLRFMTPEPRCAPQALPFGGAS